MSSSAGPSLVRRPRRSSASTSNGSTASSTGTAEGARIGLFKVILVSGIWEVMALYLGSPRANRKGLTFVVPDRAPLPHRVEAPGQNALLRVQAVFRLVEHNRLRAVHHLVGDLLAAMCRQAMHEKRILLRQRHQLGIDLIGPQKIMAVLAVLVAHRHPGVGDDAIGAAHGRFRIVADDDR